MANESSFEGALKRLAEKKAAETPPVMLLDERLTGGSEQPHLIQRGTWVEAHPGITIMDRFALEAMKVFLDRAMVVAPDGGNVKLPPVQNVVNFCVEVGLSYSARRQAIMSVLQEKPPTDLAAKAPEETSKVD